MYVVFMACMCAMCYAVMVIGSVVGIVLSLTSMSRL